MKALLLFLLICVGCDSDEKLVAPAPAAKEKTVAPSPAPAAKEVATQSVTAPLAVAQTTPAVPGLTVTADPRSTTTLDVKWNAVAGATLYVVEWKTGSESYGSTRRNTVQDGSTSTQITGLTAGTAYGVQVTAGTLGVGATELTVLAQSETSATTNATATVYTPYVAGRSHPATEGGTLVFVLALKGDPPGGIIGAPPGGLTVNLIVSDATNGGDFLAPATEGAQTVTFAEGVKQPKYSIPTVDDNQDEPDGTVSVRVVAGDGYRTPAVLASSDAPVYDNDEIAGLDLRVFAPDFIEGAGRRIMYVTPILLGTDGKPVKAGSNTTVNLVFEHVDTELGDIAFWSEETVTIPAGKSRKKTTLYVTPADDAVKESPERFRLDGYVTAVSTTDPLDSWTGRIVDNDHTAPTGLNLSVSPASVNEGAGPTSVTFTLSFGGGGSFGHESRVTIYHGYDLAQDNENCLRRESQSRYDDKEWTCSYADYARDRRASDRPENSIYAHKDYDFPNSRTITIPAGATSGTATATFDPVDDDVHEGEERAFFYVEHTFWGAGDRLVTLKGGTSIAIVDNDLAPALAPAPPVAEEPPQDDGAAGSADSTPAVSFVIYHDPDGGAAAVDRYNQAVALLKEAGISYSEVTGDVRAEVDGLAGVTNSVMPRFFLGDPNSSDWTSQPGENNGGLRWLKQKVAELSDD